MNISTAGINIIKEFEGLSLKAYPDPGSGGAPWTIGYGHTGPEVQPGLEISLDYAEQLLRRDIAQFEVAVNALVKVEITQSQFDALVSFTYNVGASTLGHSTLLYVLNLGNYLVAADQFPEYVHASGHVLPGLVRRRDEERTLFLSEPLG